MTTLTEVLDGLGLCREVCTLAICELKVDRAYQRLLKPHQVKHIVDNFDSLAFGRPLIGRRANGRFYVVDGQQRIEALKQVGQTHCPCDVFDSEGKAQEARLFKTVNGDRTSINARLLFRAALEGGDYEAQQIARIVKQEGFCLQLVSRHSKWPEIDCVRTLEKIYRQGSEAILALTLKVLLRSWEGNANACKGFIVGGVGSFLQFYNGQYDVDRLVSKLKTHEPGRLLGYISDPLKMLGGSRTTIIRNLIAGLYNKGLRSGKLKVNVNDEDTEDNP